MEVGVKKEPSPDISIQDEEEREKNIFKGTFPWARYCPVLYTTNILLRTSARILRNDSELLQSKNSDTLYAKALVMLASFIFLLLWLSLYIGSISLIVYDLLSYKSVKYYDLMMAAKQKNDEKNTLAYKKLFKKWSIIKYVLIFLIASIWAIGAMSEANFDTLGR